MDIRRYIGEKCRHRKAHKLPKSNCSFHNLHFTSIFYLSKLYSEKNANIRKSEGKYNILSIIVDIMFLKAEQQINDLPNKNLKL